MIGAFIAGIGTAHYANAKTFSSAVGWAAVVGAGLLWEVW